MNKFGFSSSFEPDLKLVSFLCESLEVHRSCRKEKNLMSIVLSVIKERNNKSQVLVGGKLFRVKVSVQFEVSIQL